MSSKISKRLKTILGILGVLVGILLVIILAGVLWPKPRPPAAPQRLTSIADLDGYLQGLTAVGEPPAISVAVIRNGSIVYNKGFGTADPPNKPTTADSTYHWWSTTKIVTATAILQLQEQGKLKLDDPVVKYLPWFKVKYPSANSPIITIRQLLNHSSGLGDLNILELVSDIHPYGKPSVNQTKFAMRILPSHSSLMSEPGSHVSYSNLGYILLGAIIEKVSGTTYEDYISGNILEPLDMRQTGFVYSDSMKSDAVYGSQTIPEITTPLIHLIDFIFPGPYIRGTTSGHFWFNLMYTDYTPSTGLIGPASEATRLLEIFLNDGEWNGKQILSPESIALITENPVKANSNDPVGPKVGLGWWIQDCGGKVCLEHTGGGPGYSTLFRIYPTENIGIVIFTNNMTSDNDSIANLIGAWNWP